MPPGRLLLYIPRKTVTTPFVFKAFFASRARARRNLPFRLPLQAFEQVCRFHHAAGGRRRQPVRCRFPFLR